MDIQKIMRSFGHGSRGLVHAITTEQNMRVHFLAAVVVIAAASFFKLSAGEWIAILLCIGGVIALECLNTSVERLADRITTEPDPLVKQAKDTAAAAVQIAAMTSVAVASVVFFPKIWTWLAAR